MASRFEGQDGQAVVLLAKKQFPSDAELLGGFLSERLILSEIFQNDIYSKVGPSNSFSQSCSLRCTRRKGSLCINNVQAIALAAPPPPLLFPFFCD